LWGTICGWRCPRGKPCVGARKSAELSNRVYASPNGDGGFSPTYRLCGRRSAAVHSPPMMGPAPQCPSEFTALGSRPADWTSRRGSNWSDTRGEIDARASRARAGAPLRSRGPPWSAILGNWRHRYIRRGCQRGLAGGKWSRKAGPTSNAPAFFPIAAWPRAAVAAGLIEVAAAQEGARGAAAPAVAHHLSGRNKFAQCQPAADHIACFFSAGEHRVPLPASLSALSGVAVYLASRGFKKTQYQRGQPFRGRGSRPSSFIIRLFVKLFTGIGRCRTMIARRPPRAKYFLNVVLAKYLTGGPGKNRRVDKNRDPQELSRWEDSRQSLGGCAGANAKI